MGLIDSLVGLFTNTATNATNAKIAEATNKANMAINQNTLDYAREAWNNQVAYNWEMFNAENAYNSPHAQAQRYREAGFNPAVMASQIGSGTASGAASPNAAVPNQLPMQAARMEAPRTTDFMGTIVPMMGAVSSVRKQDAETAGIMIDNQYKQAKNKLEIARAISDIAGVDSRTKGQILANTFDAMSMNARVLSARMQPHLMQRQMEQMQSYIDLNQINRQLQAAKLPYVAEREKAEIARILSDRDLNFAQKKLAVARALVTRQEYENMPKYTKQQVDQIASSIVSRHVVMPQDWNKIVQGATDVLDILGGAVDVFSPSKWFKPQRIYNDNRTTTVNTYDTQRGRGRR